MKKKKWFDDWNVVQRPYLGKRIEVLHRIGATTKVRRLKCNKKGFYKVALPHSFGERTTLIYYPTTKRESRILYELTMIIDCCLYELTRKKWWEFWK